MSLLRPSLDNTSKDFDALRARLFNLIDSAFPAWTDKQVASFGNVLVECVAFVGDVVNFYQDNQALESRWTTAKLRRSMLGLVKLIGYTPAGASAATTDLAIVLTAPPIGTVTIAIGDTFKTIEVADSIVFQAITSATIAAGTDPPVVHVTVEHSAPSEEIFQSTGLADQDYVLNDAPFLDGSLTVTANDGAYAIVDDFFNSTAIDRHMTISVDENDKAHIRFGNGVAGSIPSGAIVFHYKTGGGPTGNVEAGSIRRPSKAYTDHLGNSVALKCINPSVATGGIGRQTVESIRESAPRSTRANTRTVAREDYEIQALRVLGVARALMVGRDEKPSVPENSGELYVVPFGGQAPSSALLSAVYVMCTTTYPKGISFRLRVLPAPYLTIDLTARVHLAKGSIAANVGPDIRARLAAFFAPILGDGSKNAAIDFGYYLDEALAYSDLYDLVRDTPGVRKIDDGLGAFVLNGDALDVAVSAQKFPVLGTVTLVDAVSGALLP